jgi:nitrate reductase NapAB chaperone NapD
MRIEQLHIASFILLAQPHALDALRLSLQAFPEVDIVASDASGKLVFLIEARDERRITDIVDALREQPAVLSVSMVEHHADSTDAMLEELDS